MNEYITQIKTIGPQLEALPKKYPELENKPPAELESLTKQFEESTGSFKDIFGKLMEYSEDPEVMQALEKLEKM